MKIPHRFLDARGRKIHRPSRAPVLWRISAYTLVQRGKKVLMVVPTWNTLFELPGGGVHANESIKVAATRECYEESGYRVRISAKMPFYINEEWFYSWPKKTFYHSIIYVYKATLVSTKQNHKVINTKDGNEISRVVWMDLNDCTALNTHRIALPAIKILQKNNR